ncbi:MAG: right-handed parallel beta-helix repeat-containing protein [Candidatus Eremiobacteraeota bacterium]|nr:right-handed parallel beta-helix repeat-containing protein [Candidatus Eremiobacteraeota bacterium]
MTRSLFFAALALLVAIGATTMAARAQATRTWISGVGDDANPCSRTAPCKTWAGAFAKTAAGGEMDALDPGGFGALTITHSITLDGGGGQVASILVAGTTGITIAAGASDVVTLRNVRVQGLVNSTGYHGTTGIDVTQVGELTIENCVIDSFGNFGIAFEPSGAGRLSVVGTTVEGNRGGGILVHGATTAASATIDSSQILDNALNPGGTTPGIESEGYARVTVSNTTVSGNGDGVLATGSAAHAVVSQSQIVNNFVNGLHAVNRGEIASSSSDISANGNFGVLAETSGVLKSFGNNSEYLNVAGPGTFTSPNVGPTIHNRLFPTPP